MTVSEKHLPGPDLRAQGGDRLVGAVNHHGIRRGEPRGGKFDRRLHPGAQPGRQAGEELIDLAEADAAANSGDDAKRLVADLKRSLGLA